MSSLPDSNKAPQIETTTLTTTLVDSNSIADAETVLYTSKSTITVSGNGEDNGVPYTCEAVHPALVSGRQMRRTVSLSVLYPPGEPELSGYVEGETLKVGDTIKLDCRARGGNPLAQLVWFRNDEQVDFSYTTVAGKYSINTLEFTVESRDNNAVYRCVASSPILETPMQKQTKLEVYYGPSKVSITSIKDVKAGDIVPVTCRTGPSNPAAQINWVVDGRPIPFSNSTVDPLPGGGFITSANITVTITNQVGRERCSLSWPDRDEMVGRSPCANWTGNYFGSFPKSSPSSSVQSIIYTHNL